ncbi:hypothetical protein [Lentilactobacillus hilgardii]|uniref:hypothetical protein n=1 Tax=Lentilactobacillus hilgardii TaxID=1588 RepID=UPI0021C3A201|nr:hypothetical protein [Lentilactobacillus hilgardii]MCP9332606.1 hypothetical protein [Lentilactobacillus hilgardii]MCP9349213.1 hypothetical protein [Lentilactobacillus hilgardii]MCP9352082.1 hypothetical protein [Lentilactobacillus hilgardii]
MKNSIQQTPLAPTLSPIKTFFKTNRLVLVSFLALSIFNVILFLRYGWLFGAQDFQFHLQRIEELYQNSQHFNFFPSIATFAFNQNGSAVMSMYPKLPLYLFSACRLVIRQPIISYYIGIILMTFIGMVTAYFSYLSIEQGKTIGAYTFAVAYMMSGLLINTNFTAADLGISFSLLFLPLVFAGLYHWLTSNHYKMLTVGISLICLSHVLNFIFVIVTLVLLTIINFKKVTKNKLINLVKAIVLTVLVTSSFWLPAYSFGTSVKMASPQKFPLAGINLPKYLFLTLTNSTWSSISIVALLGLILGFVFYRTLPKYLKQILWISIFYIVVISNIFPWYLLQDTKISIIQFTWRFLIFPQCFLILIFSYCLNDIIQRFSKKNVRRLVFSVFILVFLVLSLHSQFRITHFEINAPEVASPLTKDQNLQYKDGIVWFKATNSYEYQNILGFIGTKDYYPKNTLPVFDKIGYPEHHAFINNTAITVPTKNKAGSNQSDISFHSSHTASIELPFVIYNHHYQIKLDSKKIPLNISKHQLLLIKNVKAGTHTVHVQYKNNAITIAVALMTVAGFIAIIYVPKKHHSV